MLEMSNFTLTYNETVAELEILYYICQLYVITFYFLLYSPRMVVNVAETCSC